jgi:integrase
MRSDRARQNPRRIEQGYSKLKNGKERSVTFSQKAIEALKKHRARQNGERLAAGSLWQHNGLVFPTTVGTTMSATNLFGRRWSNGDVEVGLSSPDQLEYIIALIRQSYELHREDAVGQLL